MTNAHPSQTELYGELLTNEQQYRADLAALGTHERLTEEQEQTIYEQVRMGDVDARNTMLAYLFQHVEQFARKYAYTYRWASHRIEYLDLVEEGNEAILSYFNRALNTDHAYAYLLHVAYNMMRTYAAQFSSAIVTPHSIRAQPYDVSSLDEPDAEGYTLLEQMSASLIDEDFTEPMEQKSERDDAPLHRAVNALNERARTVIVRHFGLYDHEPQPAVEIQRELGVSYNVVHGVIESTMSTLCIKLRQAYPSYCSHTRDDPYRNAYRIASRQLPRQFRTVQFTAAQEQRLAAAYTYLQAQGIAITIQRLTIEAHTGTEVASCYLDRFRGSHTQGDQKKRLDEAYASLQASGKSVNVKNLRAMAHVDQYAVRVYLHMREDHRVPGVHSDLSIEERLEEAYARILARGEKAACESMKQESHVNQGAVLRFLREKGAIQTRQRAKQSKAS